MDLNVIDTDGSLDGYLLTIKNDDVLINKINTTDIIALPQKHTDDKYYFAKETVDFVKYCRQNDQNHSYDILSDGDIEKRTLHSFDIWLPIIFVASQVLLPIAINVVSDYITDKRKGREDEEAQIDVTFEVKHKKKYKSIHFKGNAEQFNETFKNVDLDRWFE